MVSLYKLNPEAAKVDMLSVFYDFSLDSLEHAMLFKLSVNNSDGKLCSVYRYIYLLKHIWNSTDMILMSMSDKEALDLIDVLLKISDIRDNQIYSQHIVLRE